MGRGSGWEWGRIGHGLMVVEADYGYMGIQHAILSTPVYIQNSLQYKV